MTEFLDQGPTPAQKAPAGASAGAVLRQAREAAGLHIAMLAASLKVPVSRLEALEADRYDELLDTVFARALAGSVCRSLKLDIRDILPLLPNTGMPRLATRDSSINAPFRTSASGHRQTFRSQVSRPAIVAGLLFLVIAALLFFVPNLDLPFSAEQAVAPPVITTPVVVVAPAEPQIVPLSEPAVAPSVAQPRPSAAPTPGAAPTRAAGAGVR